jgi:uncharacterized protein
MKSSLNAASFGLTPEILHSLHRIFQSYGEITTVVLYGSRAKGTFHAGSDVDITMKGDHITDRLVGKVEDDVDELFLPYTFDISSWDMIDNGDLRSHIERVGIVIYQKQ